MPRPLHTQLSPHTTACGPTPPFSAPGATPHHLLAAAPNPTGPDQHHVAARRRRLPRTRIDAARRHWRKREREHEDILDGMNREERRRGNRKGRKREREGKKVKGKKEERQKKVKERKREEEERKMEMNYLFFKYHSHITLTILFWVIKIKCDIYVK
jgi:hypothetical protein